MRNTSDRKVLHIDRVNPSPLWNYKQEDDGVLLLSIYKGGQTFEVTGQTITLGVKNSKGQLIEHKTGITISGSNVDIVLSNSIFAVKGKLECDLILKDSAGQMSTATFYLMVGQKVLGENNILSTNIVPTIDKIANDFEARSNKLIDDVTKDYCTLQKVIIDENASANLQNQINSVNSDLENKTYELDAKKANKEDVARLSSGTPLFASNVAGMTDITKNYVNTTDGYLYSYSGGTWNKTTMQYQSTGIADNSIKYGQVYSKSAFSNINNDNLFDNPTLENNLNGWLLINNDGHVATEKTLQDSFSKGAYVPMTVSGNSLIQRIPLSKLITGEYKVRCRKKTNGSNYNGRLIIQLSNSVGTNLFEIYRSGGITTSTMEYTFSFNKETLLATYPTAVYLTISFGHGSPTADCIFYEPFIGLTSKSTSYNNFKIEELMNSIINPSSPLANKIATFNGDSICQGVVNGGGYAKILADTENLIVENKGIGGGTIAKNTYYTNGTTPRYWICDNVSAMRSDADYAIFEGGRNDYGVNVALGTLTIDYTGTIDDTTFYGGLESLFRQALLRFKEKKIGFIIIHKANSEPYTKNTLGLTMEDYYNAIIKTCKKYSIPVCNLYEESGLITALTELKTTYTDNADGLHPNDLGYKKYYVPKISAWMKTL